jgi:hypothetical protein
MSRHRKHLGQDDGSGGRSAARFDTKQTVNLIQFDQTLDNIMFECVAGLLNVSQTGVGISTGLPLSEGETVALVFSPNRQKLSVIKFARVTRAAELAFGVRRLAAEFVAAPLPHLEQLVRARLGIGDASGGSASAAA